MLINLTVLLFSRTGHYYPRFTDNNSQIQQKYMDARKIEKEKQKKNKTKNLDTSPSITGQLKFSH